MNRTERMGLGFAVGLLLGAFAVSCSAQPEPAWSVSSGFQSYHQKDGRDYRQNNYGVGVQYRMGTEWAYAGGYFRNSLDRDSIYAGAVWTPEQVSMVVAGGSIHVGVLGGVVSGYRSGVVPALAPLVEYRHRSGLTTRLVGLPPIPGVTPAVLAIQLLVTIKD